MKTTKAKMGLSKLKLTYLILTLAGIVYIGSYGWRVYAIYRDARSNMPQPQIEKLIKDFRLFHSRTKRFPANFSEVNDFIWHTRPAPDYGPNGRQARTRNYYYFYTKVADGLCAVWAAPLGPRRHYASAFFLVISNDWLRIWQGRALGDGVITKLPAIPTLNDLAGLRMQELPVLLH